jgi:murein DD-endopeptidase MepM/ murein hydrolase activator NlpD
MTALSNIDMPNNQGGEKNDTKPRLAKVEVDILEREFQKHPKPSTQVKRQLAGNMNVDISRINNWFQNRRAKRKQEQKQEDFDARKKRDALGCSEPSSPDYFNPSEYFEDTEFHPMQQSPASFTMLKGPPPISYNPQYTDPTAASIESLERTMVPAQAAPQHQEFNGGFAEHDEAIPTDFGGSLQFNGFANGDRAQFPSSDGPLTHFDGTPTYLYGAELTNDAHNVPTQPESKFMSSQASVPTPFNPYAVSSESETVGPHPVMTTFPSQLLPTQLHSGSDDQSPETNNDSNMPNIFRYESTDSNGSSQSPPPASSILKFKSLPPADIAARRKKVRPAALVPAALRSRSYMGPKTVSQAEGLLRPAESPSSSPMRRIVSAGGNMNVMSGRVQKAGTTSAQRSPLKVQGFGDVGSFIERNYQNIRQPLTAGTSLNSSLAPPTPMSPREREMVPPLERGKTSSSTSSVEGRTSFVFNAGVPGCFTTVDMDQNLASPPGTPQVAKMPGNLVENGWYTGYGLSEKDWQYDVPDEPLFTPGHGSFQLDSQMPQPAYISSASQPVTPAFGQFNSSYLFGHGSPQYSLSNQGQSEYLFPDAHPQYLIVSSTSPSMTKQKTFQFSNSTAADFSEK